LSTSRCRPVQRRVSRTSQYRLPPSARSSPPAARHQRRSRRGLQVEEDDPVSLQGINDTASPLAVDKVRENCLGDATAFRSDKKAYDGPSSHRRPRRLRAGRSRGVRAVLVRCRSLLFALLLAPRCACFDAAGWQLMRRTPTSLARSTATPLRLRRLGQHAATTSRRSASVPLSTRFAVTPSAVTSSAVTYLAVSSRRRRPGRSPLAFLVSPIYSRRTLGRRPS